jgi:hypothetical protein
MHSRNKVVVIRPRLAWLWCLAWCGGCSCGPSEIERALVPEIDAAQQRTVARDASASVDNGYACLASLRDVPEASLEEFLETRNEAVKAKALVLELKVSRMGEGRATDAERRAAAALESWAARVRACGASKRLEFVSGMSPWSARIADSPAFASLVALRGVTALEVADLVGRNQPATASERCIATAAVWLDAARVDVAHFWWAHQGLVAIVPACVRAVDAASTTERAMMARQWEGLKGRVPPLSDVLEHTRLGTAVDVFGSRLSTATRARLGVPEASGSGSSSYWKEWNTAFKALVAASNDATRASELALALFELELADAPSWGMSGVSEQFIGQHRDVTELLRVMTELASGVEVPNATHRQGTSHFFKLSSMTIALRRSE